MEDPRPTVEEFCEAMRKLSKIWPIWGFRCSGAPYITNLDEIERNLRKREKGAIDKKRQSP